MPQLNSEWVQILVKGVQQVSTEPKNFTHCSQEEHSQYLLWVSFLFLTLLSAWLSYLE